MRLSLTFTTGVLLTAFLTSSCTHPTLPVILQQNGIFTVASVEMISQEPYPFQQTLDDFKFASRRSPEEAPKLAGQIAFYDGPKREQWQEFVRLAQGAEADKAVYHIVGSQGVLLFEYFVVIRHGKELKRFDVYGGTGQRAVL